MGTEKETLTLKMEAVCTADTSVLITRLHGVVIYMIVMITMASMPTAFVQPLQRQGCTNPRRQVSRATKFCSETLNICGPSVWDLLHDTILAPKILRRILNFWKIFVPLYKVEFIISRRSTEVLNIFYLFIYLGDCGSTVVKVLCYKSEGRWFDSR